jgi:hypothetical protein
VAGFLFLALSQNKSVVNAFSEDANTDIRYCAYSSLWYREILYAMENFPTVGSRFRTSLVSHILKLA